MKGRNVVFLPQTKSKRVGHGPGGTARSETDVNEVPVGCFNVLPIRVLAPRLIHDPVGGGFGHRVLGVLRKDVHDTQSLLLEPRIFVQQCLFKALFHWRVISTKPVLNCASEYGIDHVPADTALQELASPSGRFFGAQLRLCARARIRLFLGTRLGLSEEVREDREQVLLTKIRGVKVPRHFSSPYLESGVVSLREK